jgi:hypothetical protein
MLVGMPTLLQSGAMMRVAARIFAVALAVPFVAVLAFDFLVAWGQWRCGRNGDALTSGSLIGAIGLSLAILCWRQTMPIDRRFNSILLLAPWPILGALLLCVLILGPECPFPSR